MQQLKMGEDKMSRYGHDKPVAASLGFALSLLPS